MELDKVVNGLEKMLEESKYNDSVQYNPWADTETLEAAIARLKAQEQKCRECGEATSKAIQELQAKLKAQEPRVMTLDEINAVKHNDDLIYESNGVVKTMFHFIVTDGIVDNELHIRTELEGTQLVASLEKYNIDWRCWTSRPDEKRRAETPWN
jgi:hypothetical protein